MTAPRKKPRSRRQVQRARRNYPYGDGLEIGPENLHRGAYEVGIIFVCHKHPKTEMGAVFRGTDPYRADWEYVIRPIPGTDALPLQAADLVEPGFPQKFYGFCCRCGHDRLISPEKIDNGLAVLWELWARRVVRVKV